MRDFLDGFLSYMIQDGTTLYEPIVGGQATARHSVAFLRSYMFETLASYLEIYLCQLAEGLTFCNAL